MTQQFLFDGMKAVNLNSLPPEAWTNLSSGAATGNEADIRDFYIRVPFLSRAVSLRANAISALPFAILKGETEIDSSEDYNNALGFLPNPQRLLYLIESSLFLLARAYLFREYNRVKTLGLRYLNPLTISPEFDSTRGLTGFKRQLNNNTMELDPQDLIYFWQLDPYVEIGPGNNSAAMACLGAAGVLSNVDKFAASFFERGAIKVTLLTTKGPVPEAERDRLKSWWSRLFRGKDSAWESAIVQADSVEPVVLGEGVGELSDSELIKEKREDIATAAGIPVTMLWSTEASGIGGGGVVESDARRFYEHTVVPQAAFIEGILNEQLLGPMGYRWTFRPETLDVFQEDEGKRAQALSWYVGAGFPLSVAAEVLGVELPAGMDYADLDAMRDEEKDKAAARQQAAFSRGNDETSGAPPELNPMRPEVERTRQKMVDDLAKWERKALAKGPDCPFESEHIPLAIMNTVRAALADASTDEEVKAAFSGPFCQTGWESYP